MTEDDIEEALLAAALANPGKRWTTISNGATGNATTKAAVRDRMLAEGRLVNTGKGQAFALWHPDDVEDDQAQSTLLDDEAVA